MPAVASYAPRGQVTRTSSTQARQRPQRVQLFRNDNWPPCPPAIDLPAPSFLTPQSPGSDTLLRALPTPSFVTAADLEGHSSHKRSETHDEHTLAAMEVEELVAKTAPPPVPTKAVIAASAVPLADWFADVVWALYIGPTPSTGTGPGNLGLAGADKAPQALAAFVHAVLSQTLASPQCAALGLYYLVRLPVRLSSASGVRMGSALWNVGVDGEGHTSYASVPDRERAARAGFVAELYGQGVGPGGEDVPYRLAALALMLGNKWLDDHTFTNKTWHEVTHLPLARLTALEQRALEWFNYTLGVTTPDWRSWLGVLKEGAVVAAGVNTGVVGVDGVVAGVGGLVIESMERLERELDVLTCGVGAGVVDVFASAGTKGVIGDRRATQAGFSNAAPSQTQSSVSAGQLNDDHTYATPSATEMDLDELEMEQVEIDIDLDDGGPVPDELRRPVKVRLGAGGRPIAVEDRGVVGDVQGAVGVKVMKDGGKGFVGEGRARPKEERVDEWERATRAVKSGGDKFALAREHWLMGLVEDEYESWPRESREHGRDWLMNENATNPWAREDPRAYDEGREYWLPGVADWDRARDPPVERSMARGEYEAVQRPIAGGKKVPFAGGGRIFGVDKAKGKKEMFAVGSEHRAGLKAGNVPRVELYDAHLRVRGGASEYGYPGRAANDPRLYEHSYEYPTNGAYHVSAYEAVPYDAMAYDPGLAYGCDPRYGVEHAYDARYDPRYDPGYEYTGHYGGPYVPRQVPVPAWAPRQQHVSGGCILS